MNKRSAMLVAAGLVLTLIVGGVALSVGLTGPEASQAATRVNHRKQKPEPIIRTVHRTVTVHQQGQAAAAAPVSSSGSSATTSAYSGGSTTGSYDDDQGGDDMSEEPGDDDGGEPGDEVEIEHEDHGDDD